MIRHCEEHSYFLLRNMYTIARKRELQSALIKAPLKIEIANSRSSAFWGLQ